MDTLIEQRLFDSNQLFDDDYINARALYLHTFNRLPDLSYVGHIDGEKAFEAFRTAFGERITRVFRHRWYEGKKKGYRFTSIIALLDNRCLLEFDRGWCDIYHTGEMQPFVDEVTAVLAPHREKQRREPLEINLVMHGKNGLCLKPVEIKRNKLDLDLFYGEQFRQTHEVIHRRLRSDKDKGIVLLHGLPGTGKTTYLRHLITTLKKRVLFISPSVAGNLMNPDFIELLVNNKNAVLIIEDAENIIMDRKHSPGSSVSNLLNISDGLLADCLNMQLICTFNNSLTLVDSALLRKGRLIAKYEFGRLTMAQGQRLSDHLGFGRIIQRPMTIAEIANQHEPQQSEPDREVIGFRRQQADTIHASS